MVRFSDTVLQSRWFFLVARVSAHVALALVCFLVPEVGENRFLTGSLLLFVAAPVTFAISLYSRDGTYRQVDQTFDLLLVIGFAVLLPEHWFPILVIGLVVALAPSANVQENSSRIYAIAMCILIAGMGATGYYHDIDGWFLPILVLVAVGPTVIIYAHWSKQQTDALRRSAQAHESLSLIAGGVAHDFNNILTGITGNAELALTYLSPRDQAYEPLEHVIDAGNRASRLTRQLLAFSGRQVESREPLDLETELAAIIHIARPVSSDITIELDCEQNLPPVLADPALLQQVFLNLVVNAIEASDDSGTVRVVTRHIDQSVVVDVIDEGVGIPARDIRHLFDPFFTSKSRGHGLGLATVKRILDQFDGTITVASKEGAGSTFTVTLAAAPDDVVAPSRRSDFAHCPDSARVLVIDDDEAVRRLLRKALSSSGLEIIEAADGEQGLAAFESHKGEFRFVLLDLKMPVMNGWTCLEGIRRQSAEVPVVIISGFDPADDRSVLDSDPATLFVAKPFRLVNLQKAVNRLLDRPIEFV